MIFCLRRTEVTERCINRLSHSHPISVERTGLSHPGPKTRLLRLFERTGLPRPGPKTKLQDFVKSCLEVERMLFCLVYWTLFIDVYKFQSIFFLLWLTCIRPNALRLDFSCNESHSIPLVTWSISQSSEIIIFFSISYRLALISTLTNSFHQCFQTTVLQVFIVFYCYTVG